MFTKIFADGANLDSIIELTKNPLVKGFTTNPTLMKKAGITDYESFALNVLQHVKDMPISFEVFSDDFNEMERQALKIASWGKNVNVKIPITNTKGQSSFDLIESLVERKVPLNVTAILTLSQVQIATRALKKSLGSYVSVFAGRIADTGEDPLPIMQTALGILAGNPSLELIWASPRELFNVVQADNIGCHIITVTPDILKKIPMIGYDLNQLSLDTVNMFYKDAQAAGYSL